MVRYVRLHQGITLNRIEALHKSNNEIKSIITKKVSFDSKSYIKQIEPNFKINKQEKHF